MADAESTGDAEIESLAQRLSKPLKNIASGPTISGAKDIFNNISDRMDSAGEFVHDTVEKPVRSFFGAVHKSPGAIIVILLLVAGFIGQYAIDFQHQINGDVEIYLPDGAESKDLLLEVREGWSTDIVLLYIHTDNAIHDETLRGEENITDANILKQLSYLEGDDEGTQGNYERGLDWNKEDRGREDGVVWVLSAAQIIKEANSSRSRFACSMEEHGLFGFTLENCPISSANTEEGYSIPEQQESIDEYVDNAGSLMESFAKDTNDDGIWDTGVIVLGIRFDMTGTGIDARADPKGGPNAQIRDHKAFIEYSHTLIYEKSDPDKCALCYREYDEDLSGMHYVDEEEGIDEWRTPESNNGKRRAITVTGLTPVLHDVSDAVYEELEKMLPLSLLFVAIAMWVLHRNPKVLVICGLPIVMSLAVTFGITVMADIMLTPMIIAAGPILIGLGVDYSLHLINRIEEGRNERLERAAEEQWESVRSGEKSDDVDPWDPEIYLGATVDAVMTTGNAILLSALTTIIGFSVLAWPWLVPIKPMRTVGLTLVLGIACTFFFSMIMVPALGWILRYRKRGHASAERLWTQVGEFSVKGWWAVIVIALIVSGLGVAIITEEMGKEITGSSDEVPPGLETYETLSEYSRVFEGGQTNMFIVDASEYDNGTNDAPIRDLAILDAIDAIEKDVQNVPETTTISLVTILKSIHIQVNISGVPLYDKSLWGMLHSSCWENPGTLDCVTSGEAFFFQATSREQMVDVAFDTLSVEIRSMLMNEASAILGGETQTLVYVNQPYINLRDAGALRDTIDGILASGFPDLEEVQVSQLTGGLPLSLDINEGIHSAQSDATMMTMLVLLIVMSILFRSPRMAFFTMVAVGVVVLWQPLLMRGGNVNVNVFTAMVSTIVFGIGVDDSIHIVDRIREEKETPGGIVKTVQRTGQTIFETTATTCAGLAAGLFVNIPGLRNFFLLMMLLITLALFTSSILLPAMLVGWQSLKYKITGKGSFQDLETDIIVANSSAMDAVLD
ncbi:MAG: MMPL family transporter [Candidatus Thalassarchaeaceae archaeon]|nr:MMPL family transporter [Candidatus Thalassarchaeaceae archaeon]